MHSLLENYLVRLNDNLTTLPKRRRVEEVEEMRQHLYSAYKAGTDRGESDDLAAQGAIDQFGAAEVVARNTVLAWRRSGDTSVGAYIGVVGAACLLFTGAQSIAEAGLMYCVVTRMTIITGFNSNLNLSGAEQFLLSVPFLIYALCPVLVVSGVIGALFPRKAVSTIAVAGLLTIVGKNIGAVQAYFMMQDRLIHGTPTAYGNLINSLWHTLLLVAVQFIVSMLLTVPVSRWRERRLQAANT